MENNKKNKYNFLTSKFFNRIMTVVAIIFLCLMLFVWKYKPADDLIVDNSTATLDANAFNELLQGGSSNQPVETIKPKDITINLAVIGDIMCHNTQYNDAYNSSTGEYDFSHVFTNIEEELKNADLTIGNLETTFAGSDKGYSSYPTFNTPDALAYNLKDLGLDVLCTANNHSMDKGYNGVTRTLEILDEVGIEHMGTYSSEEAQSEILVKDVNGIKIAFLAYTYGTNGIPIPNGKEYCINLINKDKIKEDLDKAKALNVDLISVNMHWGDEYKLTPNKTQKELADFLFENGVDLILGSHPHVLEPMEKRTITLPDGTTKDGFLIYSLGNFVADQRKDYTDFSIILNLQITKHGEGNITIDSYNYTPIYAENRGTGKKERFKIHDVKKSITEYESGNSDISPALYKKLTFALTESDRILTNEI